MATFVPIRGTQAQINATPIVDGQMLIETDQGNFNKIYLDVNTNRYQVGGHSGGSGSSVIITTSETSLYGKSVSITVDGSTYTGTFNSSGTVVINDVVKVGTATITSTDGTDTATSTLLIPYYGLYSVSLSFFNAQITVNFPYSLGAVCTISDGVTTLPATTSPMIFNIGNTGTWTTTVTLDGISKTTTTIITTDGQTETVDVEFGTINLTYVNDFRGQTITCTQGTTVITKSAPSSGNTMVFYPPTTGNWDISSTVGGIPYSVVAPVTSLSTPVSVALESLINATVTLHGAKGATITWEDNNGSQTETLDGNTGMKSGVNIVLSPNTPYVKFTDTDKSNNPNAIADSYSKVVKIDSSTTDIYIMPENSVYWYGYEKDSETLSTANGWSSNGTTSFSNPTYNTNSITVSTSSTSNICGVGSKNTIDHSSINAIAQGITQINGDYGYFRSTSDKNISDSAIVTTSCSNTSKQKVSVADASQSYITTFNNNARSMYVYGLWGGVSSTPTYYSAANDILYIKSGGTDVAIASTDFEGKSYDAFLPNGTYTIYSSVAKDIADSTLPYCKEVTITNATVSLYIMPQDDMMYWYGYTNGTIQDVNAANGWSFTSMSLTDPIHLTNDIECSPSASQTSAIASINQISPSRMCIVCKPTKAWGLVSRTHSSKSMDSNLDSMAICALDLNDVSTTTSPLCAVQDIINSNIYYNLSAINGSSRGGNIYGLWSVSEGTYNFYSAAFDEVYYIDGGGNHIVFARTDSYGGANVDYSAITAGTYTLFSSIADNPASIGTPYNQTINITSSTTEIKLMPNNVLYWYGYNPNFEWMTTTNGWEAGISSYGFYDPSNLSNYIDNNATTSGTRISGSCSKITITGNANLIVEGTMANSSSAYCYVQSHASKNYNSHTQIETITTANRQKVTLNNVTNNYISVAGSTGMRSKTLAVWYD